MTKPTFNIHYPLSWSSYSQWKYSKEDWYKRYILKEKTPETQEMKFGKLLATELETGTCKIPLLTQILTNRKEHGFKVMMGDIPLTGFADDFCSITFKELNEVKTGKKEWDQKRCDNHGQFDFYLLMNFITNKVPPENVHCRLFWLPTEVKGDFSIGFKEPLKVRVFHTKRTTDDIVKFSEKIKKTWIEMQKYVDLKG